MTSQTVEHLAEAVAGDRGAVAAFIYHHGDRIRSRLGGKLSPAARRAFCSEDAVAEVVARIDRYAILAPSASSMKSSSGS